MDNIERIQKFQKENKSFLKGIFNSLSKKFKHQEYVKTYGVKAKKVGRFETGESENAPYDREDTDVQFEKMSKVRSARETSLAVIYGNDVQKARKAIEDGSLVGTDILVVAQSCVSHFPLDDAIEKAIRAIFVEADCAPLLEESKEQVVE
jgi:hypothetical protein